MMMKKCRMLTLAGMIVLVILISDFGIITAQPKDPDTKDKTSGSTSTTSDTTSSKKKLEGLVEFWLNDFENCEDWRAISTCPLGDTKIRKVKGKPRPVNTKGEMVNEKGEQGQFPDTQKDELGFDHPNGNVLGVKTYFLDRGYDRVEVFPPNEYIIRGKAREVKIWALGRKFRHTLYIKLRDYRGNIHKIKIGRLDFWGWREMSVIIPGWLPQSSTYALLDKNLHFVSFFVESDKFEAPGTFYFYLDQFRIITDLSEFTGDESILDTW